MTLSCSFQFLKGELQVVRLKVTSVPVGEIHGGGIYIFQSRSLKRTETTNEPRQRGPDNQIVVFGATRHFTSHNLTTRKDIFPIKHHITK